MEIPKVLKKVVTGKAGEQFKRIGQAILAGAMTVQIVGQTITIANAYTNTGGSLGTSQQLGSPLLNNQMSADKFNPWEQIVFGIYLSNYVNPFVDTYEQAFSNSAGYGSNGAGSQSLQFSSGEEATNQDIITGMLNIIINMENNVALKPVYVSYNNLEEGKTQRSEIISQGTNVQDTQGSEENAQDGEFDASTENRQTMNRATLADLFFLGSKDGGGAYLDVIDTFKGGDSLIGGWEGNKVTVDSLADGVGFLPGRELQMLVTKQGRIPTFVLMNDNMQGYKDIVLDFTNQYDIQSFATATVKAQSIGDQYGSTMWDEVDPDFKNLDKAGLQQKLQEYVISMDCFGNLVTEVNGKRYIVYPACVNQHLTKENEINLVNQLVMNGVNTSSDQNSYILYGGQVKNEAWLGGNYLGISAFNNGNSLVPTGSIGIYYDTDSVIGQKISENGTGSSVQVEDLTWGQALKTVFDQNISKKGNTIGFKMQVINPDSFLDMGSNQQKGANLLYRNAIIGQTIYQNQAISSQNDADVNQNLQMLYNKNESQSIFGNAVAVQVMTKPAERTASTINAGRQYVNYVYQQYVNGSNSSVKQEIEEVLNNQKNRDDIRDSLIGYKTGTAVQKTLASYWTAKAGTSGYWQSIKQDAGNAKLAETNWNTRYDLSQNILPTNWEVQGERVQSKLNVANKGQDNTILNSTDDELFGRTVVIYTASDVLSAVQNVLNLKSGADFETYATDVYYTYLKFYGILNDFGLQTEGSNLNPNIFSEDLVSDMSRIESLLGDGSYMTSEQKLSAILDGTYTLLQQSLDRDYGITDFIYNQYYKMVYGRTQQATVANDISQNNYNGFLNIHTYDENPFTEFFINSYQQVCYIILAALILLLVISWAIRGKSITWFIKNVGITVMLVLLMPSIGEITPYICNTIIENAFQNSMQFWSISETLNNYNTDTGLGEFSGLSGEELEDAVNIYKSHAALNLDHTLMLKLDISKKVMTTDQTDYTALQQLQTTRWLLPMILQEWQAQDGSYDYVQVTLSSEVDNMQNMYWQYKPSDAQNVTTVAAGKVNSSEFNTDWDTDSIDITKVSSLTGKFAGYDEIEQFDRTVNDPTVISRSILYTKNPEIKDRPSNYFYILDETYPLSVVRTVGENGKTDWDTWYQQTLQSTTGDFNAAYDSVAQKAQQYVQTDPNTVDQSYGYLWTTQNPLYYFYFVTKEQMNSDYVLNDVYNVLQGDYVLNTRTGDKDLRRSDLMYIAIKADENGENLEADTRLTQYGLPIGDRQADITSEDLATEDSQTEDTSGETSTDGETSGEGGTLTDGQTSESGYAYQASRDVLDLNHLFTNVVPYLYEMTLASGGTGDGADGFFTDEDLIGQEYQVYEGNLKSWLFRSNWAIKIVENPTYNKEQTIRDADGNKYKITQTWDPSAYPAERPMVFSRAQQILQGLDDSALTTFELKCIQANEEVCDEWTKLINYLNLDDMTPEVMYREMALVALLKFNQVFSSEGITNASTRLLPNTLDIRYISFDSVMRMLMLNSSGNTQYIYNDTMRSIINNSDIFTAVLLLLAAFLCCGITPILRDIVLAFLFYLGFIRVAMQIFKEDRRKLVLQAGILLSNLMFCGVTVAYYYIFQFMTGSPTIDSVLDINKASLKSGTPLASLIVILIISIVYIAFVLRFTKFVWDNKYDMGFEAIQGVFGTIAGKVNDFADWISSKVTSGGADSELRASDIAKQAKMKGTGRQAANNEQNIISQVTSVSLNSRKAGGNENTTDDEDQKEYDNQNYTFDLNEKELMNFEDSSQIDAEIDKGKKIEEHEDNKKK